MATYTKDIKILQREYDCMCCCGHDKIGYNEKDNSSCPLCKVKDEMLNLKGIINDTRKKM